MAVVYEKVPRGEASLNQTINDIYKGAVILNKDSTKKTKAIVTTFLDNYLIPAMKKTDVSFNAIYQQIFYTGSFYDGLKIGDPDEFDLNIVLKLPVSERDVKVIYRKSAEGQNVLPGYAFYRSNKSPSLLFHRNHQRHDDWRRLESLFEQHEGFYFLSPNCLKYWFQSVVGKALNEIESKQQRGDWLNIGSDSLSVTVHSSGPARTLRILTKSGMDFSLDLVPVFYWQNVDKGYVWNSYGDVMYLVPKPYHDHLQWRLSYADKERKILHNNSCAKKCIKLLKRLRDIDGAPLKKLCSYHLKNFVILELENHTWNEKEIGIIFLKLLDGLIKCLEDGRIPSYFDSDHNIIDNIDHTTIENITHRLTRILMDIYRNRPAHMRKYFIVKESSSSGLTYWLKRGAVVGGAAMVVGPGFGLATLTAIVVRDKWK